MSWLSNATGIHINSINDITKPVVKAVKDTGHAVGSVASNPWVQGLTAAALAATGVGAPAAAAIMAAERGGGALLKPGGNIGGGLKGAATGALAGYGASKVGDALYNGLGGIGAEPVTDMGGSILGGAGKVAGAAGSIGNIGKQPLGSIGSDIAGAISGATGGLSPIDIALAGLATAQGVNAAKASARAGQFQDKALNLAESNWAAGAPLRSAGTSGLLNPAKVSLANTYVNPSNPFAARRVPLLGNSGGGL